MTEGANLNQVYNDLSTLNRISAVGRKDQKEGLKQVAKQFEALFMNTLLKTMRESNAVFSEGNYLSSNEMEFHQQNFDNQLSVHLSQGRGIGLADKLYQQLVNQFQQSGQNDNVKQEVQKPAQPAPRPRVAPDAVAEPEGDRQITLSSPGDFVRELLPVARDVAGKLGLNPVLLLAQSALETGWGKKIIRDTNGDNSFNLFGIKADRDWNGPEVRVRTLEYRDGIARQETAAFRRYQSYAESFEDYVNFLKSHSRYSDALNHTDHPEDFTASLQEAGYATDPEYSAKILRVMNSEVMRSSLGSFKETET